MDILLGSAKDCNATNPMSSDESSTLFSQFPINTVHYDLNRPPDILIQ